MGGDSIDDYIKSDNIDHFHRINDGTYRETTNDLEMLTMMPMNQDNGMFCTLSSLLQNKNKILKKQREWKKGEQNVDVN